MRTGTIACLTLASALALPHAAQARVHARAQPTPAALADEVAALRAEVAALKAEIRAMHGAPASSGETVASAGRSTAGTTSAPTPGSAPGGTASASPDAPALAAATTPTPDPDTVQITWRGAPQFKTASGWSFKPRGRIQVDAGYLAAPASRLPAQADGRGFTSRVRRAFLGAQGTMPGGFGYLADVDLANNTVTWIDLYLTYDKGPFNVTVGNHHPFTGMEQIESDLFTSFTERASFITAFNLERRVGISAGFHKGAVMVNGGVFTDDISALTNDGDKSVSVDGRALWMPKFGDLQLHVGGSAHYRDLGDGLAKIGQQYRTRPQLGTTDIRYIDTGLLTVRHERHLGAEFLAKWNRLHVASEGAWLHLDRPGSADPDFFGGYIEGGLFLTHDTRGYRNGVFDRTVPTHPLGAGGLGAVEVNVRYDRLKLTDAGVGGGRQNGRGAALIRTPTAYFRVMVDNMHLVYDIPSQQPVFDANVMGMRAQLDF